MKALGIAIFAAISTFALWFWLAILIGIVTKTGTHGGIVSIMILIAPLVAFVGGIAGFAYGIKRAKRK